MVVGACVEFQKSIALIERLLQLTVVLNECEAAKCFLGMGVGCMSGARFCDLEVNKLERPQI